MIDKYFARIGEDLISVYETPSMSLLDKQSIKIPGVKDFCWSPKQNIISYLFFCGERKSEIIFDYAKLYCARERFG
jgi:uncharacterized protein with WD repeat